MDFTKNGLKKTKETKPYEWVDKEDIEIIELPKKNLVQGDDLNYLKGRIDFIDKRDFELIELSNNDVIKQTNFNETLILRYGIGPNLYEESTKTNRIGVIGLLKRKENNTYSIYCHELDRVDYHVQSFSVSNFYLPKFVYDMLEK